MRGVFEQVWMAESRDALQRICLEVLILNLDQDFSMWISSAFGANWRGMCGKGLKG